MGRLLARIERVHGGNKSEAARELDISQPALWKLANGRSSPSLATAEQLAGLLGVSVEAILNDPRDRAAELAREGGVSETAIRRVLEEPEPEHPRPVLYWIDRMRAMAQLYPDAPPVSARTAAAPHDSQTMPTTPRPARSPRRAS